MKEANFVHCGIHIFTWQVQFYILFYCFLPCFLRRKKQCKKALFYIMIPFEKLPWVVETKQ